MFKMIWIQTDGRKDGRTEGRTHGRTDREKITSQSKAELRNFYKKFITMLQLFTQCKILKFYDKV